MYQNNSLQDNSIIFNKWKKEINNFFNIITLKEGKEGELITKCIIDYANKQ